MIENDEQLRRTREALADLEAAMVALSRKRAGIHPDRFELMAEPIAAQVQQLRGEIDAYTALVERQDTAADSHASKR